MQPSAASVKIRQPPSKIGRPPKRSESGPPATGAMAKPAKNRLNVSAAAASEQCKALPIDVSAGKPMSIDKGGSAPSPPRKTVKPNECLPIATEIPLLPSALTGAVAPFGRA